MPKTRRRFTSEFKAETMRLQTESGNPLKYMGLPHVHCRCPACDAARAILLLETGRPHMALELVRDLPSRILYELAAKGSRPTAPALGDPLAASAGEEVSPQLSLLTAELRRHVAHLGPERVAELLAVRLWDLPDLVQGRMETTETMVARLRKEP